mgnify:CR=1 FL=1
MIGFLKPAKFVTPLPESQIDPSYRRYRLQLFLTAYLGYMAYYFVCNAQIWPRKNDIRCPLMHIRGFTYDTK